MSYLDRQLAAKFKGVPFFVRSESLDNVGQARVKHTYPKTGVQYLEPMGQQPFSATIDIFFHGANFREDFQKFQKAIQDPAPGRLFLPTFGVFNSVVANPGSFKSDQGSLGEITASILFEETIDKPSPTEADISQQDVSERAQVAREELQTEFAETYPEPTTLNNVLTSGSDGASLGDQVGGIIGDLRSVDAFLRKLDGALRDADSYAALLFSPDSPIGLLQATALSSFNFSNFRRMAALGTNLPNAMNDIILGIIPKTSTVTPQTPGTGELNVTVHLWDSDTSERRERNTGRLSIVNAFRLTGLIGMYESAAAQTYTTTDEIDRTTLTLEEYYVAIIENDTSGIIIPQMKQRLDEIRGLTDLVLASKRQQAYTVIDIEVIRPVSSFLLAYELYGEYLQTEAQHGFFSDLIAGLNRSIPRNRLEGTIKVVEIGR